MQAMSDASTAKPAAEKTESKPSTSDGSTTSPAQKSARDSVGGKKEVHYGYFSNVKTPEYRSGWDSIWGGSPANGARRKPAPASPARKKSPIRLTLAFDDLPEAVQDEMRKAAGQSLKASSRLSLARREQAGAVSWTIECEVRR